MTPGPTSTIAGAELVAEELDGRLGLEPALDAVVGQRRDALKASCASVTLGCTQSGSTSTWPGPADRLGHVVEPHVAEAVEPPGFHRLRMRLHR